MRKVTSLERIDAKNRWCAAELLAADCEKAWIHTGLEYSLQKLSNWLEDMKKKDEKEKMEEIGLLHKITKPTPWRRRAQILERRRGCEVRRPL